LAVKSASSGAIAAARGLSLIFPKQGGVPALYQRIARIAGNYLNDSSRQQAVGRRRSAGKILIAAIARNAVDMLNPKQA